MAYYCAYTSMRSDGAKNRNYQNCKQCKEARQKCTGKDGIACERCIRLGKSCSLQGTPCPTDTRPAMNSGTLASALRRTLAEEDKERFGEILYGYPCNNGEGVQVIHVKIGKNGHEQVYLSYCDKNYVPIAAPEYLGPRVEYVSKLRESMSSVDVQDMVKAKDMLGLYTSNGFT